MKSPWKSRIRQEVEDFFVKDDFGIEKDIVYSEKYYDDGTGPESWFQLIQYDWRDEIHPGVPNEKDNFFDSFNYQSTNVFVENLNSNQIYTNFTFTDVYPVLNGCIWMDPSNHSDGATAAISLKILLFLNNIYIQMKSIP